MIRSAVIGAGLMGRWHAAEIARAGGRVTHVVDPDIHAASRLADRIGAATASRFDDISAKDTPSVAHVCAPLSAHAALAREALARGCHVLVEKPLASTRDETSSLFDLAASRRLLLCPVHQFLFQRGAKKAAMRLDGIGELVHAEALFCSAGAQDRGGAADEIAADILPHPLSLFHAFTPGGIADTAWSARIPRPGEWRVHGIQLGVSLQATISMSARPTRCSMRLLGTRGTIGLNLFHGYAVFSRGSVTRAWKAAQPLVESTRECVAAACSLAGRLARGQTAYPGLRELVSIFYDAVEHDRPAPVDREAAVAVAAARDAILSAAGHAKR